MTAPFTKAAVLEILRTPAASDTFPDMIRRVEALEGCMRVADGAAEKLAKEMQMIVAADRWKGRSLDAAPPEKWHRLRPETQQFWIDTASRILAALEPVAQPEPGPGDWKPIETAPRDGTWFWARTASGAKRFVHFDDQYDRYPISNDGEVWSTAPVEWTLATREDEDPECTDCGGTGVTFQTERRCSCQPETPTPGQFTTMCLAIEDVVTGRGFDVAIPEEVRAYLRNALAVGGWRGERG